jgi:hypothetical protein
MTLEPAKSKAHAEQAKREDTRQKARESQELELLIALVKEQIVQALGAKDQQRVQVRLLWKDHFRANVYQGVDAVSSRIAHSFFLVASEDGKILRSTPPLSAAYMYKRPVPDA